MSVERRRQLIEPGHPALSVVRQCELVSISRSGFYYQPVGETELNLALMRLIDAQFLDTPWYGSRQMASHLRREGYQVGRKADPATDGQDGSDADLPAPAHDGSASGAPDLSVSAPGDGDHSAEPGLVRRHHVYPDAAGVPLPGGGDGLGNQEGAVLAGVE